MNVLYSKMAINYHELSDQEMHKRFLECMPEHMGYTFYKYRGFNFNEPFKSIESVVEELEVYDDDIWITSFPKSGTTWLSEMAWLLCNDINSPKAKEILERRVLFLEYSATLNYKNVDPALDYITNSTKHVINMPHPRFIKSHLPWQVLPRQIREFKKRPRIIHVYRNPKDCAVSYYHHHKLLRGYSGEPELFFDSFRRGISLWGSCIDVVKSYWEHKNEPNVLLLKFEDMKSDLRSVILKVAEFLKVEVSESKIQQLLHHLSFEQMKNNKSANKNEIVSHINKHHLNSKAHGCFIREGKVGSHRSEMSPETIERFDNWIKSKSPTGLY